MANLAFIVEDDESQREFLEQFLIENGFSVRSASSGTAALKLLSDTKPDIVLLDLGLPDISGETVFSQIKKDYPDLPAIILTAKGTVENIIEGFNLGADDYIAKPYNADELLARMRARLKNGNADPVLKVADLEIDTRTFEVKRDGKKVNLTPKEFKLLEYLMINKGQVLSRDMILSRIWLYSPDMESRAVDVYMGYLRKKIDSKFKKKLIHTARGYGYMIKE